MIRKLFYLFIFFAPFTTFFALSGWLRIPVVLNLILFLFLLIGIFQKGRLKTKWITKEDILLLFFLAVIFISFIFGFQEKRSFNHLLAYINAIISYFFLSKYIIRFLSITSKEIAKVCYLSYITCSLIIIIDFIGKNYFDISFRNIFSTVDGKISNMDYFIRFGYFRVGGVAEEPGTMALFYNLYFGLSMYYLYAKRKITKYKWTISLFIISHFALMSNAGIVLPLVALSIIFIINRASKLTITKSQVFWGVTIFFFLITGIATVLVFDIGNSAQIAEEFFNKILFNEQDKSYSSSGQRLKQWSRALNNFVKHPILGSGPGYGVHENQEGYLSVYLTILADIGVIGFLLFFTFQRALIAKVMKFSIPIKSFLLFSVITSFLHLIIVSDFYHAPIWILFVIVQLIYKEQKQTKVL